jgi:hypothetical protein
MAEVIEQPLVFRTLRTIEETLRRGVLHRHHNNSFIRKAPMDDSQALWQMGLYSDSLSGNVCCRIAFAGR